MRRESPRGRRALRRGAALAVIALGVGCKGGSGEAADPEPTADVRVLDDWIELEQEARQGDRREALRRADAFTTGVGLEVLYRMCADVPGDAERVAALRRLLRAKLELDAVPGAVLAAWLGDPDLSVHCRATALRTAQRVRGELEAASLEAIADTLMAIAASGVDEGRPDALDWERVAAQFGRSDRVLARVRELLASADDAERARGALVAGESGDPRVAGALVEALRGVAIDPGSHPRSRGPIAETAARLAGAAALVPLEKLLVDGGWAGRAAAVPGLGHIEHPRAVKLLVLAYRDIPPEEEEEEATSAAAPDRIERKGLYDATRRLERYLVELVEGNDPEAAGHAYTLLDRASRFGPLVDPTRAVTALERARHRLGVPGADVDATVTRIAAAR